MTARDVAFLTLSACERQGAWSDGYLKKAIRKAQLDRRDAALATRLCYGVLQNRMLLDFYISQFSTKPPEKMEINVRNALRLGIYQMAFLTRIPHSAAVNESVELTRNSCKNPRAAGLVNGVLRNISRSIEKLPVIDQSNTARYLSIRYSHPIWLAEEFIAQLGREGAEALLAANNAETPATAQVNTCRTTEEEAIGLLQGEGVSAQRHPWLPDCLTLLGTGDLEELDGFRSGLIYIQDAAARLAVIAAGLAPGMRVLDACAAPGGKSFAAAMDMKNQGEILSCDIHPHKKALIEAGAGRLGLSCIRAAVMDAGKCNGELNGAFDAVIADVPCSGLGVIRKKPEIRYHDPKHLKELPEVQKKILNNLSAYVKPGGILLYATCTLLRRENEDVVSAFMQLHPEYETESFVLPGPVGAVEKGAVTLWPHIHGTDGFFIARLRRKV